MSATKDPLSELSEEKILLGEHQLTFMDTSLAWKLFKQIYQSETDVAVGGALEVDEGVHARERSRTIALKNFQEILDGDQHCSDSECKHIKPPDFIQFDWVYYKERNHEPKCEFCHKNTEVTKDERHFCRICDRVFHEGCLVSRGFCSDELSAMTLAESANILGWSCPDCEGLFSLLSGEEQEEIIELFNSVSGDDGVIDREEFLNLQKEEYEKLVGTEMPSFREKQEMELFSKIDRDHTGSIDYWEFLHPMAIRYLSRRSSMDILNLLTPKEVVGFKEYFVEYDVENVGSIPQTKAKEAYVNWYRSKVKECGKNYIDFEWYGGLKENHLLQSIRESLAKHSPEKQKLHTKEEAKEEVLIHWSDYLKHCTLHILSARANTGEQKPLIPPMPSILYATDGLSRAHDDFLKLCDEAMKWTNYLERKGFTV